MWLQVLVYSLLAAYGLYVVVFLSALVYTACREPWCRSVGQYVVSWVWPVRVFQHDQSADHSAGQYEYKVIEVYDGRSNKSEGDNAAHETMQPTEPAIQGDVRINDINEINALLAPLLRHRPPREEEQGGRITERFFPWHCTQTDPPIDPPPSSFDSYSDPNEPVEF